MLAVWLFFSFLFFLINIIIYKNGKGYPLRFYLNFRRSEMEKETKNISCFCFPFRSSPLRSPPIAVPPPKRGDSRFLFFGALPFFSSGPCPCSFPLLIIFNIFITMEKNGDVSRPSRAGGGDPSPNLSGKGTR